MAEHAPPGPPWKRLTQEQLNGAQFALRYLRTSTTVRGQALGNLDMLLSEIDKERKRKTPTPDSSGKFLYSRYALPDTTINPLRVEDLRGQAMYMQDSVSNLADEENTDPSRWFFAGFHDILGHLVEMTEEEGMDSREEQMKEREKRKRVLAGALCATNAIIKMAEHGEFNGDH